MQNIIESQKSNVQNLENLLESNTKDTENNENESLINKDCQSEFDPSALKHYINRKTFRGRKVKSPLPELIQCEICLEYKEYSLEKLISCSVCKCTFHPCCYHLPVEENSSEENFVCERCQNAKNESIPIENIKCFICNLSSGVLKKNIHTNKFYHILCLKLIPELYENSENDEKFIDRENIRKWRYKNSCRYCNEKLSKEKTVLKCSNPKCKNYYHIPCAIAKGMIFSTNYMYKYYCLEEHKNIMSIPFYCSSHNKKLAGNYRKDVLYNENYLQEALEEKFNHERKFSSFEDNNSELFTTISNNNDSCNNCECTTSTENNYEEDNEEVDDDSFNTKICELNFNQLIIDEYEKDEEVQEIDFNNVSPKEKNLFQPLNYRKEGLIEVDNPQ